MKKSSHHSKNSIVKLYKPIGGMCNTISGEYIKDNQACSISGVIYNEDTNTFQGSPVYNIVTSFANRKFTRLFNVEYKGKNAVFGTYSGGITNITEIKNYPVETCITPTDIIYNQDGLYISSSSNVYHLNQDEELTKIAFSFAPFMWQRISARQSISFNTNAVAYYGDKIYFSDNRGTGYMSLDGEIVKILNYEIKVIEFFPCSNTLFACDTTDIYTISGDEFIHFLNYSHLGLRARVCTSTDYSLLILNYDKAYEIYEINTLTKAITKYNVNASKGLGTYGIKYLRVINNKYYLLINESDETLSNNKASLYKLTFNGSEYNITEALFENFVIKNFLMDVLFINSKLICYFGSPDDNLALNDIIELYEYSSNRLVYLSYSNSPANTAASQKLSVKGNRLYCANNYGIYYVDILPSDEDIPCLLVQNGRLIVPQNSNLYFSGAGDFYNWSWNTDSDALFTEIGYKDGGRIIYAALVLDSIIVFKDNGSIYRLAGSYPYWTVSKLGEIDKLTTKAITFGSEIIFGASSGIKKIGVTEYYGDFFLSDYQQYVHDKNISDVSLCSERNTIIFINNEYIFEYSSILKGFTVYNNNQTDKIRQIIEIYENNGTYSSYALNSNGILYKADKTMLNNINVKYKEVKNNQDILIKAVTVFTPELQNDKTFTLQINEYHNTFTLKAKKTRHKYFILKRLNDLQLELSHDGDFFIDNIFIEYSTIGE